MADLLNGVNATITNATITNATITNVTITNATIINAAITNIGLTSLGSDWYLAVTALMAVSTITFSGLSFRVPRSKRIFYYITSAVTMVATITYFTMGSNLGYAYIRVEFLQGASKEYAYDRQVFYVRYIDWAITTPLILMDLLLTTGLPWPTILYAIFIDEIMIISLLVGAIVESPYKFAYFGFATTALSLITYIVLGIGRKYAKALGKGIYTTYLVCSALIISVWYFYPIAWALSEGANVISPDNEAIFYGVLDILAKPFFGFLLLTWGHRKIDPATIGLHMRDYDEPINQFEKTSPASPASPAIPAGPASPAIPAGPASPAIPASPAASNIGDTGSNAPSISNNSQNTAVNDNTARRECICCTLIV